MSEKKMVRRSVAVTIGIVCIIVAAALGVVAYLSYSLQNQVSDLTSTLNLGKSTVVVDDQTISQPANSYTVWTFSASYAGYVSVLVQSSSVAGTHVKAIYSSNGVSFNQEIVVNAGHTANFPVLPSSSIQIEVGNGDLFNGATETVTITYNY
jgi:predicted PurR-regulated permease PerM